MLFLPIGRENAEVRRHAWVSYAVIALNILMFLGVHGAMTGMDVGPIEAKWQETFTYLSDHPYLQVPPQIERFLSPAERLRNPASIPGDLGDSSEIQRQQKHLDSLAADFQRMSRTIPLLRFAYVPAEPSVLTLITSMFMHGDLMHLLGNLLFFFVTAPFVEDVFGRPIFVFLYFSGGIIATETYVWHHPGSYVPLIGASGAIAAVMGAYLVRFIRTRLEFILVPFLWRPTWHYRFFLPAFVVLPFWFASQMFLAVTDSGSSGVAFWAHVGGFVWGIVIGLVMRGFGIEQKFIHPKIEGQISWQQSEQLIHAMDAFREGDVEMASRTIRSLLHREPENIDARRLACEIALASRDWRLYGESALRLLEHAIRHGESEVATALIREVTSASARPDPRFLARAAAWLEKDGEVRWALDLYSELVHVDPDGLAALRATVRLATIRGRLGEVDTASSLLTSAARHPLCSPEWISAIETERKRLGVPGIAGGAGSI
ncbi:MAG: rhomboid family intramembrane serine protease [Thermoanaerobaculia bacterium]